MVKIKQKDIYKPLVITGYTAFAGLVLSVLISTTIPLGTMLFNPNTIKINVTVSLIALTIGAILPIVIGYLIGDRNGKSKSHLAHHFNGVLYGLLAYWILILSGSFIQIPSGLFSTNIHMLIVNLIPSLFVAIVATTLSVKHARSPQKKKDVLEYIPFIAALIAGIISLPLLSVFHNITTGNIGVHTIVPPAIVALFGLVSYVTLRSKTNLKGPGLLAWSAVSVSVLFALLFVVGMLTPAITNHIVPYTSAEHQVAISTASAMVAIIGWIVYLVFQVRSLKNSKK